MPVYRVRIFKSLFGRAGAKNQWSNQYSLDSANALDSAQLAGLVQNIVTFEKGFHLTATHFMRAVISTWEKESDHSDPTAFRVIELTGTGTGVMDELSAPEVLALTLRVKFGAVAGRGSQKYYRGCLTETMISAGADGSAQLDSTPGGFQGFADTFLGGMPEGVLVTANSKSDDGTPTHNITQITVAGASVHKTRNRHKKKKAGVDAANVLEKVGEVAAAVASVAAFFLTDGASEVPEVAVAAKPLFTKVIEMAQRAIQTIDLP